MKPCKQKQQIMHCRGNLWNLQRGGREGTGRAIPELWLWAAIGSGFHDTRTMKHSRGTTGSRRPPWVAHCFGRGRSGRLVSYIYWWTQVGRRVSPIPGETAVCAAVLFGTQRQFSLHLAVYFRGISSADRTSAIGLEVKHKCLTFQKFKT